MVSSPSSTVSRRARAAESSCSRAGPVSRAAAAGLESKLLPLPTFLRAGGEADWPAIFDGLRLTGHFLGRDILVDRRADVAAARERLVERLKRAVA